MATKAEKEQMMLIYRRIEEHYNNAAKILDEMNTIIDELKAEIQAIDDSDA